MMNICKLMSIPGTYNSVVSALIFFLGGGISAHQSIAYINTAAVLAASRPLFCRVRTSLNVPVSQKCWITSKTLCLIS